MPTIMNAWTRSWSRRAAKGLRPRGYGRKALRRRRPMSKHAAHDWHRVSPQRREDPLEIWRARERDYIGLPMERLLIFLLFMALFVGLGLLIGGCQDFYRAVARLHWMTIDPLP